MIRGMCGALAAALVISTGVASAQTPGPKTVITDQAQLPRTSYPLSTPPSVLLQADDATFAPFAAAVKADVDTVLRDDDIRDLGALRDYLQTRLALQLLAGDDAGARVTIGQLRAAQSKDALKLLSGRLPLVRLDADQQAAATPGTNAADRYAAIDAAAVNALPWAVVQDAIKSAYAGEQTANPQAVIGSVQHEVDPIVAKSGALDGASARELVQTRAYLRVTQPMFATDVPILKAYIAAHDVTKPDIWAARDVTLTPSQIKAPVVIGILDSGVDPTDYPGAMYVDAKGMHGIAFADDASPSTSMLYPMTAGTAARYPQLAKLLGGASDLQSGIDSPAAAAFRTYYKALDQTQGAAFAADLDQVVEYVHGSHVAGIAIRGNPGARIAVLRFDDNLPTLPVAPSEAWAKRMAANFATFSTYIRVHHIRVVNMSWADQVSEFEEWYARKTSISDPQARKAAAQHLYDIWRSAVSDLIEKTPGTLFVAAAGNQDSDASFQGDVPASLQFPNLLVVGAVNQAGDPASFTSYGPTVAVYADGFQVPSKVPGGFVVKESGTSMASPNVANVAAKLFALDPALTPVQVRALIVDGATASDDGKRKLVSAKNSIALLRAGKY